MNFAHESLLYLCWLLIPVVFLLIVAGRKHFRRLNAFNSRYLDKTITRLPSKSRLVIKGLLFSLASFFVLLSLAQPRWGFEWREVKQNGMDVMLALDVSKSMLAADFKPNRLERAKREVLDLLDLMEGDRVGLLAFAGTAFVQCPLTVDYSAARLFINYLNPDLIPVQGTALGEAVLLAVSRLEESSANNARGRAVIVISDGEDQGKKVEEAIEAANKSGVKIYTVGMGSKTGAPIPDQQGGFKKDRDGNVILSRFNEATLQRLASETGGKYVPSVPGDLDLQEIYFNGVRGLGEGELEDKTFREKVWYERFQIFILIAILLLLVEAMISRTSLSPRGAQTKKAGSRKALVGSLFVFLITFSSSESAFADPRGEAHKLFEDGKFAEAAGSFGQAEVDDPEDESIKYNKGVSLYKAKKFDEAIAAFKEAMNSENAELRDVSEFNLGNAQVGAGKLEDAVKTYEGILKRKEQDKKVAENLAFTKKLIEQQKQQQQQNDKKKQNEEKKDNQENQNQQDQNKNEQQKDQRDQQQAENNKKDGSEDQQQQQQENQQQETAEQQKEQKSDDSAQQGDQPESEKESQMAKANQNGDEQKKINKQEAARLLRTIEDKMAKYMVKPNAEELKKYKQENTEKDW